MNCYLSHVVKANSIPTQLGLAWRSRTPDSPNLDPRGDKDTFPLDGSREWTASLPNSRLFIMQDVGHLPFAEAPELFIAAAEVFLRGAWPDSAVELSGR